MKVKRFRREGKFSFSLCNTKTQINIVYDSQLSKGTFRSATKGNIRNLKKFV